MNEMDLRFNKINIFSLLIDFFRISEMLFKSLGLNILKLLCLGTYTDTKICVEVEKNMLFLHNITF